MERTEVEELLYRIISQQYSIPIEKICYGEVPLNQYDLSFHVNNSFNLPTTNITSVVITKKTNNKNGNKLFKFYNKNEKEEPTWFSKILSPKTTESEIVTFMLDNPDKDRTVRWRCAQDLDLGKTIKEAIAFHYDKNEEEFVFSQRNKNKLNNRSQNSINTTATPIETTILQVDDIIYKKNNGVHQFYANIDVSNQYCQDKLDVFVCQDTRTKAVLYECKNKQQLNTQLEDGKIK